MVVECIGELMEEFFEIVEVKGVIFYVSGGGGEVIFENVSFVYWLDDLIFCNFFFCIVFGENVVLVGFIGFGKSMIICLFCCLYEF